MIEDYNKLFLEPFKNHLKKAENKKTDQKMSTFEESNKSKKTLKAMTQELKKDKSDNKDSKKDPKKPIKKLVKKSGGSTKPVKKNAPTLSDWKKGDRTWEGKGAKGEEAKKLDFGDQRKEESTEIKEGELEFDLELPPNDEAFQDLSDDEENEEEITDNKPKKRGFFANLFSPLTGKTLEVDDLDPVIKQLKDHIIKKNVASQIAEQLCDSVLSSLKGKHLGSFKTVSSTVNSSLRDSLTKILTPKKPINILRDVKDCQSKGIPYTMVFCGKFHLFDLIFFFLLFLKESTEVQKYFFFFIF